jgi:hypothetical protein
MKYFLGIGLLLCVSSHNTIIEKITSEANAEKKLIAVYFSGSDWCANCHKFSHVILSDFLVDSLLHHQYVYYTADFPQRTELADSVVAANEFLAEKLNPEGVFPLLVITDADWNIRAQFSNGKPATEIQQQLKTLYK